MIQLVDTKFNELKNTFTSSPANVAPDLYENIVSEAVERINRANNIILYNVAEPTGSKQAQIESDNAIVTNILSKIEHPDATFIKATRLGKTNGNKPRILKVSFPTPSQARTALRNKKKLNNTQFSNVSMSDDKTPKQVQYLRDLREILKQKIDSGDNNLTIKYIKGAPQIVDASPKNSLQA